MEQKQTLLEGYSDEEKGAYLTAIAAMATADSQATEEEKEYLNELAAAAELSPEQQTNVQQAAEDTSGSFLQGALDILKRSELRFALVADLVAFSKADQNYSEEEQKLVEQISQQLGINNDQYAVLNQVADTQNAATAAQPAEAANFGGLQNSLQKAGINGGGLLKGLLAMAAPMILSRMMGRRGGGFGGGMGGMGGGLGSLIGMLSGNRGFGGTGGLLGKILGGRRGF